MIRLEVNEGAFILDYEVEDVPTCGALISKFQNDHGFRFCSTPRLVDTSQSRICADDDPTMNGRYYYLSVWIEQQVDEQGVPVSRS